MQKIGILKFFLSVFLLAVLYPALPAIANDLFSQAAENAAVRAAQSLSQWVQGATIAESEKSLAVWDVANDADSKITSRLQTAILKTGQFKIYSLAETDDFKRILKEHGRQLKYQDRYDPSSLAELGKLIAPRRIIVGLVENERASSTACELTLRAKMLDLQTGEVLWAEIVPVQGKVRLAARSWVWRIATVVASVIITIVMVFAFNWQTLNCMHYWILMAVMPLVVYWFLIGRFL